MSDGAHFAAKIIPIVPKRTRKRKQRRGHGHGNRSNSRSRSSRAQTVGGGGIGYLGTPSSSCRADLGTPISSAAEADPDLDPTDSESASASASAYGSASDNLGSRRARGYSRSGRACAMESEVEWSVTEHEYPHASDVEAEDDRWGGPGLELAGVKVPAREVYTIAAYSEALVTKLVSCVPSHFISFVDAFRVDCLQVWLEQLRPECARKASQSTWRARARGAPFEIVVMELCSMDLSAFLSRHRTRTADVEPSLRSSILRSLGLMEPANSTLSHLNNARLARPQYSQLRFVLFAITVSLLAAKLQLGLEWNDLAFRNVLLQELDPASLQAVYCYRVRDRRDGYCQTWLVPRKDLLQVMLSDEATAPQRT